MIACGHPTPFGTNSKQKVNREETDLLKAVGGATTPPMTTAGWPSDEQKILLTAATVAAAHHPATSQNAGDF
ncbi:hypothetical protein TNIN_386031 [Trichonephila inaurata madagascariensis]|uniref:Uncharacterized protein n=1 Tax=Trichonephila inaurata madagascariensis TaxID=2747483 RepID=A0A8X7CCS6_9ARAC|nr:hypothetical protein TNIN_386031 [Trichonephila inaurata madagascariensis]